MIKESKRILIPIFILVAAIIILGLYPEIVFKLIQPVVNGLHKKKPNAMNHTQLGYYLTSFAYTVGQVIF